jgi:hypothetical protein
VFIELRRVSADRFFPNHVRFEASHSNLGAVQRHRLSKEKIE